MLLKKVSIFMICSMISLQVMTPVYASFGWSTSLMDSSGSIRVNISDAVPAGVTGDVYLDINASGDHVRYAIDDATKIFTKDIGLDVNHKTSPDRLKVGMHDDLHASVTVNGVVYDTSDIKFVQYNSPGTDVFIHNPIHDPVTVAVYDDNNRQIEGTQTVNSYDNKDQGKAFLPVWNAGKYRVVVKHGSASAETVVVAQTTTIYDDTTSTIKYTSLHNQQAFFDVTNDAVTVTTPPSSQYTKVSVDSSVYVYDQATESWVKPDGVIPDVWYRADANGNITSPLVQLQLISLFPESGKDDITMPAKYKNSTFKIVARFGGRKYVPTVLFGRNLDSSFDNTDGLKNGWTFDETRNEMTVYAKPSSFAVADGGSIAVHHHEDSVLLASGALGYYVPNTRDFQLNDDSIQLMNRGLTVSTNAESFTMPRYSKSGSRNRPNLALTISGPTYMEDGKTKNLGYFQAYLPPTLLKEWKIESAAKLLAEIGDGTDNQNAKGISFEATGDKKAGITLIIRNHGYSTHTVTISSQADESTDSSTPSTPSTDPSAPIATVPVTPSVPDAAKDLKEESGGITLGQDSSAVTKETTSEGKVISKVVLSSDTLMKAIDLLKNKDKDAQKIYISAGDDTKSHKFVLPAAVVMEAAGTLSAPVISIKSNSASYNLPLKQLDMTSLAAKLGANTADISVNVTIEQVDTAMADQISSTATQANVTMLAQPVDFHVSVEANNKKEEISAFPAYVSRSIELSGAVDPSNTTGVLYNPETKAMTFVPTVFTTVNGKTQATLMRKGNSIYTIVKSDKTFDDLTSHWAKADIELLASKMVIHGITDKQFMPNDNITRAQFAAVMVRALGLTENAQDSSSFTDTAVGSWYSGAVAAAVQAGLIDGYEDHTFRPEETITREQMAVLVARSIKAAGKIVTAERNRDKILGKFIDRADIAPWATASVVEAADSEIMKGRTDSEFSPSVAVTRAEAATVLKRFLQVVGFINE